MFLMKTNLKFLFPLFSILHLVAYSPPALAQTISQIKIPSREYVITIHYDLGMHCTGFDLSYCCILPPYNSILAQIIKTADSPMAKPVILTETDLQADHLILWYQHVDNTYSEGPKMLYWNVPVDVNGDGDVQDPSDSFANAYFQHLLHMKKDRSGICHTRPAS